MTLYFLIVVSLSLPLIEQKSRSMKQNRKETAWKKSRKFGDVKGGRKWPKIADNIFNRKHNLLPQVVIAHTDAKFPYLEFTSKVPIFGTNEDSR